VKKYEITWKLTPSSFYSGLPFPGTTGRRWSLLVVAGWSSLHCLFVSQPKIGTQPSQLLYASNSGVGRRCVSVLISPPWTTFQKRPPATTASWGKSRKQVFGRRGEESLISPINISKKCNCHSI